MLAPNQVVGRNVPVVYKRIRIHSSDSDEPSTPKRQASSAPIIPPSEITTAVKERRFRNMVEMFPDLSPIVSIYILDVHIYIDFNCT